MQITSQTQQKTSNRRGVTAVEFAIVFPIILFTFFGLWEYARLEMIRQATATACYDGARRGTLPGATSAGMSSAAQRILDIYSVDGAVVTASVTDDIAHCDISVPLDENAWITQFVVANRFVTSECEFNRERFGLTNPLTTP